MALADAVINLLPKSGAPIPFGVLSRDLNADDEALRAELLELAAAGRTQLIFGRGWRRLPDVADLAADSLHAELIRNGMTV